ncbi:MAG: hypothetical protein A2513_03425 [Sulfurimonas sp. RIFOXYD12_FULL_33_39]|nr:MAG: hypothetical protein A2513_03425 [Sulfurimonas sp. RIFOXYD12_FULL_33_39]
MFGINNIMSITKERNELLQVKNKTTEAKAFASLIHELQIERGLTAGVIVSNGTKNKDKLQEQRKNTDKELIEAKDILSSSFNENLLKNRASVDSLSISLGEGTGFYTKAIASLVDGVIKIPSLINNKNIAGAIQAYSHITLSKESLGRTRAILNGAFIKNAFAPNMYTKLCTNKGIIESNNKIFTTLATPEALELFKKNGLSEDSLFVNDTIALAISKPEGNFSVDASVWFTKVTNTINGHREVEKLCFFQIDKMVNEAITNDTNKLIYTTGLFILIIFITLFFAATIGRNIAEKITKMNAGLSSFFNFLGQKQKTIEKINCSSHDEFGAMSAMINDNIYILEKKFNEQQKNITDFNEICDYAAKGFLYHRITSDYEDTNLKILSNSFNGMLDEIERTFKNIIDIIIAMARGDYSQSNTITNSSSGAFASMLNSIGAIRTNNSEIFAVITKFSQELNKEATELSISGDELSTSANEQASSLEETAAAIEELTSNVAANVAKTEEMTKVAQDAKTAAQHGNNVATESLGAMNEIVNATEAIADAVSIIENIAFQTNILSLNAAVEAATAGDAGKGFAVVAQEVRNLANRSADAAKQIQELSYAAREKSQGGLQTTQNMMDNFSLITKKIEQTDELVRDVTNASREQMDGINQINNAISQLDQMTQQNAKTANNVAETVSDVLYKTEQLESMLTNIKYDKKSIENTCDVNLLFTTTKLKLDHINYKENNYAKLKSEVTPWKVVGHHDCNLGKWIDANSNESFAKTPEWQTLLKEHEHVHAGVQSFIHEDLSNASKETMFKLSQEIENATIGVFKGLDNVKINNCKDK